MTEPDPKAALVVGFGSIGSRHARVLGALGLTVGVVSRRGGAGCVPDLETGLAALAPGLVVVATETADHGRVLDRLAALGYRGRVLVEKPLFAVPRTLPAHRFAALAVGYNLRFHPALQRLQVALADEPVLTAQLYVGQYLPDWRPGRDYRSVYSAQAGAGGGVLRDLSHELDLAHWLFGPWQRLTALGGHLSPLAIDSDDAFLILGAFARCPVVSVQLSYLDRAPRRTLVVNTASHTLAVDLIAGTFTRDRDPPERFELDRDMTYRGLHRAMLADDRPGEGAASAADGLAVVAMIAAAEQAAVGPGRWVMAAP